MAAKYHNVHIPYKHCPANLQSLTHISPIILHHLPSLPSIMTDNNGWDPHIWKYAMKLSSEKFSPTRWCKLIIDMLNFDAVDATDAVGGMVIRMVTGATYHILTHCVVCTYGLSLWPQHPPLKVSELLVHPLFGHKGWQMEISLYFWICFCLGYGLNWPKNSIYLLASNTNQTMPLPVPYPNINRAPILKISPIPCITPSPTLSPPFMLTFDSPQIM